VIIYLQNLKGSLMIALSTFFITILVTLSSQSRIEYVHFSIAIIILMLIIFTGVFSDMIGVAATAAEKEAFNAKSAKRVYGAKYGLFLLLHADRVATFMCDIIGDICGTISGAIGAIIVVKIINTWGGSLIIVNLIVLGIIASLTVGGKAYYKTYGINRANDIILFVGKILAGFGLLKKYIEGKFRGEL
jgi:CBS domain containing-hemolysin-like protein